AGLRSQALSVDDQVRQAWQGASVGHARLAALAAARQSVERQLAATRAGVEEGARTTLDLLNAQQARAGIVREQAALRHDTLLDWLRLQAATGDLDPAALARVNALLN
ncbi:TolC family protein, partial [Laribacter hongkongensis]|uniref:TolC family protein n=1 Tax=Laribacter hongkongensis TaxID=168471 RepID=UPI001EFD69A5